jgi:8-oxo-dGTP pyrophosphatase MutT (NUDIX family)
MKDHGPWKIKSSEQRYQDKWVTLRVDQVIRPDKTEGTFAVVDMVQGASTLAIDDEGFVYLTEEFRYAVGRQSIEVVSGAIDEGETPLQTAERELKEEAGIEAQEWIELGRVDPMTSALYAPSWQFIARKLSFGETKPDGSELIKIHKVKLEEAVQMVMDCKIIHAQSCTLILKAARYLKKL